MVQAPAPDHVVAGGLPTEAMVAQVLVCKYADALPLYRQAGIREPFSVSRDQLRSPPRPAPAGAVPQAMQASARGRDALGGPGRRPKAVSPSAWRRQPVLAVDHTAAGGLPGQVAGETVSVTARERKRL